MNTILITGATGFLGGAVAVNLLKKNENNRLLLLVRGDSPDEGLSRLQSNLAKFGVAQDLLKLLTPDNIIIGDLAEPDQLTADTRLDGVTHVLTSASVSAFGAYPYSLVSRRLW